jgi:hypothetical protein
MAIADQLKALLKSHMEGDDQRFFSVAMQLAAHEAKYSFSEVRSRILGLL